MGVEGRPVMEGQEEKQGKQGQGLLENLISTDKILL